MNESNSLSKDDNNWRVECSDDENYGNYNDNYRIVNGKRIWEPKGEQIAALYAQLEKKGFIELRWQCPGRRSPSVHSSQHNANDKKNDNMSDTNVGNDNNKANELNEFDFENEFTKETALPAKVNPRRRSNQGK